MTIRETVKKEGNGNGIGKGTTPAPAANLLAAKGKTYGAKADAADAALERLNKAFGPSKPGSEMLIVGHGV